MTTKTKKYYWLKLKENFFDDDEIEWLEEQENGKEYCLFYLKLCLKSLKTNGILIRNVGQMLIPYDVKKLAEITKTSQDTVRVAMEVFKNIGLVQILENGEIYMTQLERMVGSETSKAQLMRNKRAKEKQAKLEGGNNVTETLPKCYTELEKEKELRERAEEKEKETNRQTNTSEPEEKKEEEFDKNDLDHIELIKDLFASWSVSDSKLLFLYSLAREQIHYEPGITPYEYDIRVYEGLQRLTMKARAEDVKYIYAWMQKLIPLSEF